jgi:phosphate starvation-inducible PhoH-like protein
LPKKKYKHNGYAGSTNFSLQTQLKPKTVNQSKYLQSIDTADVVFCAGPAGSGKTAIAVACACQYLIEKRVEKIVIARPTVESGRGLGHLPGTYTAKIQPYLIPILEEMHKYLTPEAIRLLRNSNAIELCPLEYMRGRNFHHSFMILDEAQNATFEQIKMFITRMGKESKAILNGDPAQSDLYNNQRGGFSFCMDRLNDVEGIAVCKLEGDDIVRNDIIARILDKLIE